MAKAPRNNRPRSKAIKYVKMFKLVFNYYVRFSKKAQKKLLLKLREIRSFSLWKVNTNKIRKPGGKDQIISNSSKEAESSLEVPPVSRTLQQTIKGLVDNIYSFKNYFGLFDSALHALKLIAQGQEDSDMSKWGKNPLEAMHNYLSQEVPWVQLLEKRKTNRFQKFDSIAKDWDWNHFLVFISGAKLNQAFAYLTSTNPQKPNGLNLTGHIWKIIWQNVSTKNSWNPAYWLNTENLVPEILAPLLDMTNLAKSKEAQKILIEALFPLIKKYIFKRNLSAQVGVISWSNNIHEEENLNMREVFSHITHLLSPAGKKDLAAIILQMLNDNLLEDYIPLNVAVLKNYSLNGLLKFWATQEIIENQIQGCHDLGTFNELNSMVNEMVAIGDIFFAQGTNEFNINELAQSQISVLDVFTKLEAILPQLDTIRTSLKNAAQQESTINDDEEFFDAQEEIDEPSIIDSSLLKQEGWENPYDASMKVLASVFQYCQDVTNNGLAYFTGFSLF